MSNILKINCSYSIIYAAIQECKDSTDSKGLKPLESRDNAAQCEHLPAAGAVQEQKYFHVFL